MGAPPVLLETQTQKSPADHEGRRGDEIYRIVMTPRLDAAEPITFYRSTRASAVEVEGELVAAVPEPFIGNSGAMCPVPIGMRGGQSVQKVQVKGR